MNTNKLATLVVASLLTSVCAFAQNVTISVPTIDSPINPSNTVPPVAELQSNIDLGNPSSGILRVREGDRIVIKHSLPNATEAVVAEVSVYGVYPFDVVRSFSITDDRNRPTGTNCFLPYYLGNGTNRILVTWRQAVSRAFITNAWSKPFQVLPPVGGRTMPLSAYLINTYFVQGNHGAFPVQMDWRRDQLPDNCFVQLILAQGEATTLFLYSDHNTGSHLWWLFDPLIGQDGWPATGVYELYARAMDPYGNVLAESNHFTVNIESPPPGLLAKDSSEVIRGKVTISRIRSKRLSD